MENKNTVNINGAIIKNVSSPDTIMRVARDKGMNPQEVFVRIVFTNGLDEREFSASNKLKYLTRTGYQSLLDAKENGTPMDITVDLDGEFFYINTHTSVDDLFAEKVEPTKTRTSLAELLL